jgi:TM2 domain-containing membrane protein YozV
MFKYRALGGRKIMYSVGIAYLLWLVSGFGMLGFHRFYLGKIPTGILWMCTGGLCGIGALFDFFTLSSQVRDANLRQTMGQVDEIYRGYRHNTTGYHTGDTIEQSILKVARINKGILTPADLALTGNISLDDAKKALDAMVSKGFAEIQVRKTGSLVYVIPDMRDTDAPLEEF